jgi:hypothetical protein
MCRKIKHHTATSILHHVGYNGISFKLIFTPLESPVFDSESNLLIFGQINDEIK